MAKIYLRLPLSRCLYYRNRNLNNPLQPHDPIKFSEYSEEFYVIKNSVYNKVLSRTIDENCFSQCEWMYMMNGQAPTGGAKRIIRDRTQWLSYEEINILRGKQMCHKTNQYDYLCIKLPNEVFCIDTIKPVTPTWTLDSAGIKQLKTLINNDFKRTVMEWVLATFDFCTDNGEIIMRSQPAVLERFLMRYGIEPSLEEKNNIRRVIDRWIKNEQYNFESYSCFDMRFRDAKEKKIKIKSVEID